MNDMFDLRDRVVVVTGGAGQLGAQFSRALRDRGANVAILDAAEPARIARRIGRAADGEGFMFVSCDVTDRTSIASALAAVQGKWGPPYGLLNCAALDSPPEAPAEENGPFESYPESSWDKIMDVNVKGVFLCCQIMGGAMAQAGRGSIINIGSIYGLISPDQGLYEYRRRRGQTFYKPVAYSVSKSALLNLTRYLATYWGRTGVRVNTLTFGGVYRDQDPEFLAAYSAKVPLGRMAQEHEYNGAVVFLLSDAASYMTGANIVIDGGWTAW